MEVGLEKAEKLKEILGKVDFILSGEAYYYLATGQEDMKKFPAYEDIFTYENCGRIVKFMQDTDNSICVQASIFDFLKYHYSEYLDKIIKEKYQVVELEQYNWVILVSKENFENIGRINEI